MSIRIKLILSFVLPSIMLMNAGIWSSFHMRSLGKSVDTMLDENENSIRYAVQMNQSLERIDSGVLLRLQGEENEFQKIYSKEYKLFQESLDSAYGNITLEGEKEILDSLKIYSEGFLKLVDNTSGSTGLQSYRMQMFPLFEKTQQSISDLRLLNSDMMHAVAYDVLDKVNRAALPGDLMAGSAILFIILFIWLTQLYIVNPIIDIQKMTESWRKTGELTLPKISTKDELQKIVTELDLINKKFSENK